VLQVTSAAEDTIRKRASDGKPEAVALPDLSSVEVCYDSSRPAGDLTRPAAAMNILTSIFDVHSFSAAMPLIFAGILLLILIISFRSRAVVFCQYLSAMTGIALKPSDVRRVYRERGKDGVREFFLDLIIREDLKQGPIRPKE
jgi:hypothetical protein